MPPFKFRVDGTVVDLSFTPDPLPLAKEYSWERVAVRFMQYAFRRRTLWIASDDERTMTLGWLSQEEADQPNGRVRVGRSTYSLWYVGEPSDDRLFETISSGDFTWDAMYFVPLGVEALQTVQERVKAYDATAADFGSPGEMIASYGDGRGLQWIDYAGNREDIERELAALIAD